MCQGKVGDLYHLNFVLSSPVYKLTSMCVYIYHIDCDLLKVHMTRLLMS